MDMSSAPKTYRLGSSGLIYAPGIVAWAINGYAFEDDQPKMLDLIARGWGVPEGAAKSLLGKSVPYSIEGEAVVFTA